MSVSIALFGHPWDRFLTPVFRSLLRRSVRISKKAKSPRVACPCPSCGNNSSLRHLPDKVSIPVPVPVPVPVPSFPLVRREDTGDLCDDTVEISCDDTIELYDDEAAVVSLPPSPKRPKLTESSELLDDTVFILPEPTEIIAPSPIVSPWASPLAPLATSTPPPSPQEKKVTVISSIAHFPDCDCQECEDANLLKPILLVRGSSRFIPILIDSDNEYEEDPIVKNLLPAFQAVTIY